MTTPSARIMLDSVDPQYDNDSAELAYQERNRARGRFAGQVRFDFEYCLEMYKPKEKRRRGYFALPVLHHDQLVGKVDAVADREASVLRVHAIHEDVRFTAPSPRPCAPSSRRWRRGSAWRPSTSGNVQAPVARPRGGDHERYT